MSKSIFISCVFEDKEKIVPIQKWVKKGLLGDVVITYEIEDKRQQGKEAVRQYIRKKIEGAAFILVLVGQDTHNHDWIEAEVELANSFHKEIICVRIPNTTGVVPQLLINRKLIAFHPNSIKQYL